jgi:hypothetical protein
LVRLLRKIDDVSTVNFNALAQLDSTLSGFNDRSLVNFYFIKDSDSPSLSFFTKFPTLQVLDSFRSLLMSLPDEQCRLVILFFASLLRFPLCTTYHDACPLCRKTWLWDHFLECPKLRVVAPVRFFAISDIERLIRDSNWPDLLAIVRSNLLAWASVLQDVVFPMDVIAALGS